MSKQNLSVGVALVNKDKVLVQLRDNDPKIKFPGYWCLPGGGVENSEEPSTSAIRELREETGYVASATSYLTSKTYNINGRETYNVRFFVTTYDGKQTIKCYEGQKMEFKTIKELMTLKIIPGQVQIVEMALKRS